MIRRGPLGRLGLVVLFGALFAYLILPVVAVLLYSLATRWTQHILPDGYTLTHWQVTFANPRIVAAFLRSIGLATAAVVLDILLVVPAVYWSRVRNRRIRPVLEVAAAIPFALPYLVVAFGILTLFGNGPTGPITAKLINTPFLLAFGHAAIAFPFLYWAVDGAMAAADVEGLSEAAETCGATSVQIIRRVVAPNITPGLVAGGILVFATSLGEFAMVQLLAGGGFETVPLFQADALQATVGRLDELAVTTFVTFVILFVLSAGVVYFNRGRVIQALITAETLRREKP
ncbi:MAG TPA: ABC transporter permease subunit [Candidatus Limnocylindrales bacterium]|jgi:putative spermidine/putrescine transport system permease protein